MTSVRNTCATMAGVIALTVIAGCSRDSSAVETQGGLAQTIGALRSSLPSVGRGDAAAQPAAPRSADAMAAEALRVNPGPLILATVESTGQSQAMGLIGNNGARRTFATPGEQALVLENGLLVATRGLGNDMSAADIGSVAGLIHARRPGNAQRTNYYYSGDGTERALPVNCTISLGEAQSFAFAGRNWSARQVAENCQGNGASFSNSYLVAGDGSIVLSRQWIGPALGYVTIQTIRP